MSIRIICYPNDAWSLFVLLYCYQIVLSNLILMLLCREVLDDSTQALKPWIETRSVNAYLVSSAP